ncbi:MAG: hypothetical protein ABJK37_09615 [Paraglaciecola sp.]|uniref:hypothetical protein n=1 Tax=Paraglaciecola sp. TaxID=1920173 RepID=UPI003296DFBA
MEHINDILTSFSVSLASILVVCAVLWKADDVLLSSSGATIIYKSITATVNNPETSEISKVIDNFINGYFLPKKGYTRFFKNVFTLTFASLLIALSLYTAKTVGLFDQLLTTGFLGQFFGNGFVVTYFVNLMVFLSYPVLIEQISMSNARTSIFILILDVLIKILIFLALTALTYIFFADFYGAFGGSKLNALKSIPPTMHLAVQFNNLTSVYLYSIILSSFPIFVVVIINLMRTNPNLSRIIRQILFWLPFEAKPLRAISIVFSLFMGLFLLILSLIFSLIGYW